MPLLELLDELLDEDELELLLDEDDDELLVELVILPELLPLVDTPLEPEEDELELLLLDDEDEELPEDEPLELPLLPEPPELEEP